MNKDTPRTNAIDDADDDLDVTCARALTLARELERENHELREACHVFLKARKHNGYGLDDAESAVRSALANAEFGQSGPRS